MQSDEDSLTKLLQDVEVAASDNACRYFNEKVTPCAGCPARDDPRPCLMCALDDIARRLHALMPHDMDGREIKAGDTIKSTNAMQMDVTDVMALPVLILDGDGTSRVAAGVPHLWRVMEPDSWEKLEQDAYHLVMSEYLDAPEDDVKDLVRRAKALAKAGEGL